MSELTVKIVAPEVVSVKFPGNIDGKEMEALFRGPLAEDRAKDYAAALELLFEKLEGVSLESAVEFVASHAHTDDDVKELHNQLDEQTVELT